MSNTFYISGDRNAELWTQGPFDSFEAAEKEARLYYAGQSVAFIGELEVFVPHICANQVLEQLVEDCDSECGGEAADMWTPDDAGKEAMAALSEKLNAVLQDWLTEHKEHPRCGIIGNIKEIKLA